ncbi:MAG: hypothetical protein V5A24_04450 [Haloarculaceae archaeon]
MSTPPSGPEPRGRCTNSGTPVQRRSSSPKRRRATRSRPISTTSWPSRPNRGSPSGGRASGGRASRSGLSRKPSRPTPSRRRPGTADGGHATQVEGWLKEDLGHHDVTNEVPGTTSGRLVATETGVVAGLDVACAVFGYLDVAVEQGLPDGERVADGDVALECAGGPQ